MIEAKKSIRNFCKQGNYPIHISDDSSESLRISEQLLNNNSIHFFNNSVIKNNKKFNYYFNKFDKWIKDNSLDKDRFCIEGSSVMSVYGLRDAADLDYISLDSIECPDKDISLHAKCTDINKKYIHQRIYDPRHHFYYNGYKFLTLEKLYESKINSNGMKVNQDLTMIKGLMLKQSVILILKKKIIYKYIVLKGGLINFFRKNTPSIIYPYFKKIYNMIIK